MSLLRDESENWEPGDFLYYEPQACHSYYFFNFRDESYPREEILEDVFGGSETKAEIFFKDHPKADWDDFLWPWDSSKFVMLHEYAKPNITDDGAVW